MSNEWGYVLTLIKLAAVDKYHQSQSKKVIIEEQGLELHTATGVKLIKMFPAAKI